MLHEAKSIIITQIIIIFLGFFVFLYTHIGFFIPLLGAGILFLGFTFYFFRNPNRIIPGDSAVIVSPADGTILNIDFVEERLYLKKKVQRITIFLSVFNVHVNRIPFTGKVEFLHYQKGKFKAAFNHKASEENEQHSIGLSHSKGKILFKQITGFIARRIISYLKENQNVEKGDVFGMIKFGSRCDVFFEDNVEIKVKIRDKVKGGETILGIVK